jgi:TolB protein
VAIFLLNLAILALLAFGLNIVTSWLPGNAQGNKLSQTATGTKESTHTSLDPETTLTPTSLQASATVSPPDAANEKASATPNSNPSSTPDLASPISLSQDLILLSLHEGGMSHLFAYQPQAEQDNQPIPLTRLTNGPWQDIDPALSPDGRNVAFASDRNGYWDIYLLEISTGLVSRVTDSLEYDSSPSWSPDGSWLVYETYLDDNMELMIQSLLDQSDVLRLTNDPAADYHPTWSPQGRLIAFVSNRSGESEIWLADLDKGEVDRFQNISKNAAGRDDRPSWSPDGLMLAWAGEQQGFNNVYVQSTKDTINLCLTNAGVACGVTMGILTWS